MGYPFHGHYLNHRMGKPTVCIGKNKGADQLCTNCEADQRLCFHYMDSTIHLVLEFKISTFWPFSLTVQTGLCPTWSETQIVGFLTRRLIFFIAQWKQRLPEYGSKLQAGQRRIWYPLSQQGVPRLTPGRGEN